MARQLRSHPTCLQLPGKSYVWHLPLSGQRGVWLHVMLPAEVKGGYPRGTDTALPPQQSLPCLRAAAGLACLSFPRVQGATEGLCACVC